MKPIKYIRLASILVILILLISINQKAVYGQSLNIFGDKIESEKDVKHKEQLLAAKNSDIIPFIEIIEYKDGDYATHVQISGDGSESTDYINHYMVTVDPKSKTYTAEKNTNTSR